MARKSKQPKNVETLRHDEARGINIPKAVFEIESEFNKLIDSFLTQPVPGVE
jgi:hypothetical protein